MRWLIDKNLGSSFITFDLIQQKHEAVEDRVRTLTEQLETQYELHKNAAQRARKSETDAHEYKERLNALEGELVAGDVLRDGFRSDKELVGTQVI